LTLRAHATGVVNGRPARNASGAAILDGNFRRISSMQADMALLAFGLKVGVATN
jgi:hypothetical protein